MEPSEPQEPSPPGAEAAAAGHDALRRLEERLERASAAAERLIAEAGAGPAGGARAAGTGDAGSAEGAGGTAGTTPPPAGWQAPLSDGGAGAGGDVEVLAQLIQSLRELIPPDLQRRLAEAVREVLLAVRALIDWYLERAEQRRAEPTKVQDIPIQ